MSDQLLVLLLCCATVHGRDVFIPSFTLNVYDNGTETVTRTADEFVRREIPFFTLSADDTVHAKGWTKINPQSADTLPELPQELTKTQLMLLQEELDGVVDLFSELVDEPFMRVGGRDTDADFSLQQNASLCHGTIIQTTARASAVERLYKPCKLPEGYYTWVIVMEEGMFYFMATPYKSRVEFHSRHPLLARGQPVVLAGELQVFQAGADTTANLFSGVFMFPRRGHTQLWEATEVAAHAVFSSKDWCPSHWKFVKHPLLPSWDLTFERKELMCDDEKAATFRIYTKNTNQSFCHTQACGLAPVGAAQKILANLVLSLLAGLFTASWAL